MLSKNNIRVEPYIDPFSLNTEQKETASKYSYTEDEPSQYQSNMTVGMFLDLQASMTTTVGFYDQNKSRALKERFDRIEKLCSQFRDYLVGLDDHLLKKKIMITLVDEPTMPDVMSKTTYNKILKQKRSEENIRRQEQRRRDKMKHENQKRELRILKRMQSEQENKNVMRCATCAKIICNNECIHAHRYRELLVDLSKFPVTYAIVTEFAKAELDELKENIRRNSVTLSDPIIRRELIKVSKEFSKHLNQRDKDKISLPVLYYLKHINWKDPLLEKYSKAAKFFHDTAIQMGVLDTELAIR